jgi:hypothetical protein
VTGPSPSRSAVGAVHDAAIRIDCHAAHADGTPACKAKAGYYCALYYGDDPDAPQFHIARVLAALAEAEHRG